MLTALLWTKRSMRLQKLYRGRGASYTSQAGTARSLTRPIHMLQVHKAST